MASYESFDLYEKKMALLAKIITKFFQSKKNSFNGIRRDNLSMRDSRSEKKVDDSNKDFDKH